MNALNLFTKCIEGLGVIFEVLHATIQPMLLIILIFGFITPLC